jgi:Holliday junction resolvasome RuvABC endonuclease subunit
MRILGIDPSSTAIGWAEVGWPDHVARGGRRRPRLVDSNSRDLSGEPPDERFLAFREWVFAEVDAVYRAPQFAGPPTAVAIERPQVRYPIPAMLETVGMVRAAVCNPCYNWDVLPMMHPKTARKLLGIGGNATKAETAEHVRRLLGDSAAGLDGHAIDAAAVAIAARYQLQQMEVA